MRGVEPAEPVVAGESGSTVAPPRQRRWTPVSALEFAGCDAIRMTLAEYEALGDDDKVEFFDSAAGLAWRVQEPVAWQHERPGSRLVTLVARIAMTRGSLIECVGAGELRLLNPESGQVRAIHPDQMVLLHPERGAAEIMSFLKVGEDAYPDVVLEVDNTRDTRRDKLALYEEWGFPELWVEVPNAWSPSRPRGLRPELRIYLLEGEQYVLSPESRAFVGWRAEEIHRALNDPVISEETSAVLERVGRALGEREGTGLDDDPWLGSIRRRTRAEGLATGRAEGLATGRAEGLATGRAEGLVAGRAEGLVAGRAEGLVAGRAEGLAISRAGLVRAILASRGIRVSEGFPSQRLRGALARASDEAVASVANAAESEADFLARLE